MTVQKKKSLAIMDDDTLPSRTRQQKLAETRTHDELAKTTGHSKRTLQDTVNKNVGVSKQNGDLIQRLQGLLNNTARSFVLQTGEDINICFNKYLEYCEQNSLNPSMNGWATFMNMTKTTLSAWEHGANGESVAKAISLAHQMIEEYDDTRAQAGEVRDAVYIFRGKNYHGMRDMQETVHHTIIEEHSAEDIQKRLESMVVLDAEFTENK